MPRSKSKGRDRTNDLQNKIKIRRQSRSKSPSKRQSSSFYHQIDSDGSGTISFNEQPVLEKPNRNYPNHEQREMANPEQHVDCLAFLNSPTTKQHQNESRF